MLELPQEISNTEIIYGGADDSADQRREDGHPPDPVSVRQTVILKSDKSSKETRTEIAGRIDGIPMHPSEAHSDGNDYEPNHKRRKV